MVRFLHTADVQLGKKATDATSRGERQRQARLDVLRSIVKVACEEEVDFILIAGDMFDDNQVKPLTVQRAVQLLHAADPIPVYVLPGNHDLLGAGSVYERDDFKSRLPGNIRVLREPEEVPATLDCVVYPCPQLSSYPVEDPLGWIPGRGVDDRVRLAVVHGNLPGIAEISGEACPAFNAGTAVAKGLDYTALGHWHRQVISPDNTWAYPGTPEQGSFGEQNAGQVLVVSIGGPGQRPEATPRRVACLQWLLWEREVRNAEDVDVLQKEVEGLPSSTDTLLRISLEGHVRADELPRIEDFAVWLRARVENGDLLQAELVPEVQTTEALEGALRALATVDPLVARVVADLRRMADPEADRAACESQQARPLEELIHLWAQLGPPGGLRMGEVASEALTMLARQAMEMH